MTRPYQGGYVQLPASVILDRAVEPGPLRLWALLMWIKGRNAKAWPSENTLAEDLGVSLRTVRRWKKRLLANGYLSQERRFNQSNLYVPCLPNRLTAVDTDGPLVKETGAPADGAIDGLLVKPTVHDTDGLLVETQTAPPLGHERPLNEAIDGPLTTYKELTPLNQIKVEEAAEKAGAASALRPSGIVRQKEELAEGTGAQPNTHLCAPSAVNVTGQELQQHPVTAPMLAHTQRVNARAREVREYIRNKTPEIQDHLRKNWPTDAPNLLVEIKDELTEDEMWDKLIKLDELGMWVDETIGRLGSGLC
jgi:hypothetical protein